MVAVDSRIARTGFSQVIENTQKNGYDEPVTGVLLEGSFGETEPAGDPQELADRNTFGQVSGDRMRRD
jgi:hypothetical protein